MRASVFCGCELGFFTAQWGNIFRKTKLQFVVQYCTVSVIGDILYMYTNKSGGYGQKVSVGRVYVRMFRQTLYDFVKLLRPLGTRQTNRTAMSHDSH